MLAAAVHPTRPCVTPQATCSLRRVADPLRHFSDAIPTLVNPIGSVRDKLLVGLFRLKSLQGDAEDIFYAPETTTLEKLKVRLHSPPLLPPRRIAIPYFGALRSVLATSALPM